MRTPKLAVVIPLLVSAMILAGQSQQGVNAVPGSGTREMLVSIVIPPTPGAPFSATLETEWVKYLGNGSRITLRNHRVIARDKTGKVFQERRRFIPDGSGQESWVTQTEIYDPAKHEQYTCKPQTNVCQLEKVVKAAEYGKPEFDGQESLGKQTIAGLETTGTRVKSVIATGTIGNDSPIESKREFWYSEQLGFSLLTKREDPRSGTQRFEVTEVTLGEPDEKLFAVPEGAKVLDVRDAEASQ